jgi:fatty acyl-CoA reductase
LDAKADIVPCDMVVNMLVVSAWHTAIVKPKKVNIYHCTTGTLNPFTWGEIGNVVTKFFKKNPLESVFRRPNLVMTSRRYVLLFSYFNLGQK